MPYSSLKIPLPDAINIQPPKTAKKTGDGWKTIRVRKQLYDILIMLQAAKILHGNPRPSMADIVAEIATIAVPSMFTTPVEDTDASEEADV